MYLDMYNLWYITKILMGQKSIIITNCLYCHSDIWLCSRGTGVPINLSIWYVGYNAKDTTYNNFHAKISGDIPWGRCQTFNNNISWLNFKQIIIFKYLYMKVTPSQGYNILFSITYICIIWNTWQFKCKSA